MVNHSTYSLVEADIYKNKKDIVTLWEKNLSSTFSDRYTWMYQNNIYFPSIILLTTTSPVSPIGFASVAKRMMKIGNQIVPVGQTIDFLVDKEHRHLGPALKLQRSITNMLKTHEITFLYGFPNRLSERVQRRAGFMDLGPFHRWVIPIRSEYLVQNYISNKLLAKCASSVLDILITAKSKHFIYKRSSSHQTKITQTYDDKFDRLWEKGSKHFSIIGERNAKYLAWRFNHFPNQSYKAFCLYDNQNHLQSYIVYYIKNQHVIISDFFASDFPLLNHLFFQFMQTMRSARALSITVNFFGTNIITSKLRELGFKKRSQEGRVLLYFQPGSPPSPNILDTDLWYITEADRDV
jgi:hypothetical protein